MNERGSALVTAIATMGLIMALGIVVLDATNAVQQRVGTERARETAFNLSEGALSGQVRTLVAGWPTSAQSAPPASCTRTSTSPRCLSAATLVRDFAAGADANWSVQVRDNVGAAATYYSRATLDTTSCGGAPPCLWDSNRDGQMWVRASATVHRRTRTVVALVRQQLVRLPLPRNTLIAGHFTTNNNGLKVIVDTKGCEDKHNPTPTCNTTQPAPLVVGCTTVEAIAPGNPCLGLRTGQVSPEVLQQGTPTRVLTPQQIGQVRDYARQTGRYFTSCPTVAQLTGPVVFIDGADCSYVTGVANSEAAPGAVVVNRGRLTLGGNFTVYGVIYATNNLPPPGDAGDIVTLTGTAFVQGAIFVEGRGRMVAGASGLNLSFDEDALGGLTGVTGGSPIVQGSFRELPGGQ